MLVRNCRFLETPIITPQSFSRFDLFSGRRRIVPILFCTREGNPHCLRMPLNGSLFDRRELIRFLNQVLQDGNFRR